MMGFMSLSELAHRLEDFFKVLKSRPCDDVEVQHLLLKAVDQLQAVITLHRQGVNPNEGWWRTQVEPLLNELHGRLGDPTAEDDLTLLSGDDGQQMRVVLFETEVEACLQRLETVLDTPANPASERSWRSPPKNWKASDKCSNCLNLLSFVPPSVPIWSNPTVMSAQRLPTLCSNGDAVKPL